MTQAQFQQKYGREPSHVAAVPPVQQAQPKSLMDTVGDAAQGVSNFIGAKGLTDLAGSQIAKLGLAATGNMDAATRVEEPTMKQVLGSTLQTGANFIPGAGGAGLAARVGAGAATGYAMDVGSKLQNNEADPLTPGIATGVAGSLPIVGAGLVKPTTAIIGRLLKGVGSGLSGVSGKTIDQIVSNPQSAIKASQTLAKNGNDALLEKNARTIVNGISKVRQDARQAFGNALGSLKSTDINPQAFRQAIQPTLDKFGSTMQGGQRTLSNVEFSDPKNIQRASDLVDRLNILPKGKMDGATLRKLADDIENSKFKIATSDERLSFNHFADELSGSVKDAINGSTDKLQEMNQKYSKDMGLAETMQNVFGKVKFKNLPEVVKASQQLETLFAKKGLAPHEIDNFLTRIGVHPADFKTSEAVRQIGNKSEGANSIGLSPGELSREATSAIVSPELVKNLSIASGVAKETLEPLLRSLKTPTRNAVVQLLLKADQDTQQQETGQQTPQ